MATFNPTYSPNPRMSDGYNEAMANAYAGFRGGYSWWDRVTDSQVVQNHQFFQQMVSQNMANEYNLPVNQMDRFTDAGINANLAAAGIAGSGDGNMTPVQGSAPPDVAITPQDIVGAAGTIADSASTAIGALSQKSLNKSNEKYLEILGKTSILHTAGEFVSKLGITETNALPVLNMVLSMFGDGFTGVQSAISSIEGCRQMDFITNNLEADYDVKMAEFAERMKNVELMETELGVNVAEEERLKIEKEKLEYERDMQKLRLERSRDIGFPLDDIQNSRWYMLYKNSRGDFDKFADGLYQLAFAEGKGESLSQTLFGQVNNPYATAQQLTAQAIYGITKWVEQDDTPVNPDSGVYREGREYSYDSMLDIFLPLVNSKAGEGAVESALSDMITQYGYSKDDVMRFFNEWHKNNGRK